MEISKKWVGIVALTSLTLLIMCANPENKNDKKAGLSNSVTISATIKHSSSGKVKVGATDVDSIYAIATVAGEEFAPQFGKHPSAIINPDGTFKINLEKGAPDAQGNGTLDWILLLINSKAETQFDKIVGFLALKELDQSLIKFPIAKSRTDSLVMGIIKPVGNEFVPDSLSNKRYDTATFDLTIEQLKQMAQTGKTLKIIKNMYASWNPTNEKSSIDIRCLYTIGSVSIAKATDHELMPQEYLDTSKYSFSFLVFSGLQPYFNWPQLANRTQTLDLYPPPGNYVMHVGLGITSTALITDCISTDSSRNPKVVTDTNSNTEYPRVMTLDDGTGILQRMWYPSFKGISKNGVWTLKANQSTVLTKFDLGLGNPFDTITGKPSIYVPSIHVSVNPADTTVQQVSVKWYYWDTELSQYIQVTDLVLIRNNISYVQLTIADGNPTLNGSDTRESCEYNSKTVPVVINFTPTKKITFAEPEILDQKRGATLEYATGGQTFFVKIWGHKITNK